jgi:hypothetical protein
LTTGVLMRDGGNPPPAPIRREEVSMIVIPADEVRSGDVVDYRGTPHRVSHVDRRAGWAWPVAYDEEGWAMALGRHLVVVQRAA